jgi:hypothetical protein
MVDKVNDAVMHSKMTGTDQFIFSLNEQSKK